MRVLIVTSFLFFYGISSAFAEDFTVEVKRPSGADICLYDTQSGEVHHAAPADGNATFSNLSSGPYEIVASQTGWIGQHHSVSQLPGNQAFKVTLDRGNMLNGPTCKSELTIRSFVANKKNSNTYSESIPINFTTNAQFSARNIDYCVAEGPQGARDCRINSNLWRTAQRIGDNAIIPAYEGTHSLTGYRDVDLTLMIRYGDNSQTTAPAFASIYRRGLSAPAIMTGSVKINDDAAATADTDVQIKWSSILTDPTLRVQYCIKQLPAPGEPSSACSADLFKTISPKNLAGNVAEFESEHTLAGNPGMKTLSVEVRYEKYPDLISGAGRDGIVLSQDIISEFPCFAESLGVEGVVVEDTSEGPVYVIPGREALRIAQENGWSFTGTARVQKGTAQCLVLDVPPDSGALPENSIHLASVTGVQFPVIFTPFQSAKAGSCSFRLFEERMLAPGWTFQSATVVERYGADDNGDGVIDTNEDRSNASCQASVDLPNPGSRSMPIIASLRWTDEALRSVFCNRLVSEIRLRGPACADWRDAFASAPR